jgi:MinD-like ATPase involved in chromosome partitioning or flagellar assembly
VSKGEIVSVHSFRGGTGKSNTSANLAYWLAKAGHRVAVIDTDIQSPGIHVLFGCDPSLAEFTLNDFLGGRCRIEEAAQDVGPRLGLRGDGALYLIPSSMRVGAITQILRQGYDVARLNEGLRNLIDALELEYLLIDTHPGINEETLLSIALSGVLVMLLRPDQQDYQGTAVTLEIARMLEVPKVRVVLNKVPTQFDAEALAQQVAETYSCEVAAVIPHSDRLMALGSEGLFSLRFPDDPIARTYRKIALSVLL